MTEKERNYMLAVCDDFEDIAAESIMKLRKFAKLMQKYGIGLSVNIILYEKKDDGKYGEMEK